MHSFLRTDLVAQLVEHLTFNERVLGSNPSQVTKKTKPEADTSGFVMSGNEPNLFEQMYGHNKARKHKVFVALFSEFGTFWDHEILPAI